MLIAFARCHRQSTNLATFDEWNGGAGDIEHIGDLSANHVHHCGRVPLIRHVQHCGACLLFQKLCRQMVGAADASRTKGHGIRVLLRVLDQLFDARDRDILVDDEDIGVIDCLPRRTEQASGPYFMLLPLKLATSRGLCESVTLWNFADELHRFSPVSPVLLRHCPVKPPVRQIHFWLSQTLAGAVPRAGGQHTRKKAWPSLGGSQAGCRLSMHGRKAAAAAEFL